MIAALEPLGYRVLSTASGQQALDLVEREVPDLILLDLMMPGMNGYEVCTRLKAEPATQFVPIVMVTASTNSDKVRAIELGADDFLTKPLDHAELRARVRSLLRIKSYHDTIERQSAMLADWVHLLEERVQQQVEELQRVGRLRRFLPPQLADVIAADL
jgi:DNA-binding response OmpR family regulator